MSLPHVCECRICGRRFPLGSPLGLPAGETAEQYAALFNPTEPKTIMGNVPVVPTETSLTEVELAAVAIRLAGRAYSDIPTCTHGYTRCMPCKFPPVKACGCEVQGCTGCGEFP